MFCRCLILALCASFSWAGDHAELYQLLDERAADLKDKVIAWRRDFHQNPELSNREVRTAKIIAEHLRKIGVDEVQTEVAHTGVVGVLKGGLPGPVIALRADIDGLPVIEATGLPFASTVKSEFNGNEVGVMHACGHDAHIAILMGAAEVLVSVKDRLPGTVKFIFQPAEEGAPKGERGGAELMVEENVLKNPDVEAIFGLHISSQSRLNTLGYRPGGIMASSDRLEIIVHGQQTHGASPWLGVDPIVVSAQIIMGLQTITSRQSDLTRAPAVVTIGSIHGGVRSNIIPDKVEMVGTIRTLDPEMRHDIHERIRRTATAIANSMGATADVTIDLGYGVTYNHLDLTDEVVPILERVAGKSNVQLIKPITGAEDFSFFARETPGFYFFLGAASPETPLNKAPNHHSPTFFVDERSFQLGVRAMLHLTFGYLTNRTPRGA